MKATRERRFRARAVRIDSTVIEADVKYPTDSGLAAHGVRALAREGKKLAALVGEPKRRVRDRSRAMGRTLRALTRTIRRRSGEAKSEVLKLTGKTGKLLERSIAESKTTGGSRSQARARKGREGEAPRGGQARAARRTAARRSPNRSSSASQASRSRTGWCRSQTRMPARSGRASSASRTSSAMWPSSPK